MRLKTQSHTEPCALWALSDMDTARGASAEVVGIDEEDPMCMEIVVSVSSQAAQSASQSPVYSEEKPSLAGFSLKAMAWLPLAAQRRTSAAAGLGVPQRDEGQRDQKPPSGSAAPIVDHPVVVDLQAERGRATCRAARRSPAGEARKSVRVADPDLLVVEVHVGQTGRLVVGARTEVLVDGRQVLVPSGGMPPDACRRLVPITRSSKPQRSVHLPSHAPLHVSRRP